MCICESKENTLHCVFAVGCSDLLACSHTFCCFISSVGRAEFLIKPLSQVDLSAAASSWHNNHNNIGGAAASVII